MSGHALSFDVRVFIYAHAASTGRIPQVTEIATGLDRSIDEVGSAIRELAAGHVLVLAPNDGQIWAAEPFCATPTNFRVESGGITYWALCIWDALGVPATLDRDAIIETSCGDCAAPLQLVVKDGRLEHSADVVHFGVPARHFWDNLAFT